MATIVLPTRNRPTAFSGWLAYMDKFYGKGPRILVAEGGSDPKYTEDYLKAYELYKDKLNIGFYQYDKDVSIFERLIDVMKYAEDDFVIPSADDDFPVLEAFNKGIDFLKEHEDYSVVISPIMMLSMKKTNTVNFSLLHALQIDNDSAAKRIVEFAQRQFPTFYSVVRKDYFVQRHKVIEDYFISGFGDYLIGIYDCAFGKIKLLDEFSYIRSHNQKHSYFYHPDLFSHLLENGSKVLAIRDYVSRLLHEHGHVEPKQSHHMATNMIKENLGRWFGLLSMGKKDIPEKQQQDFRKLFNDKGVLQVDNNPYYEKIQFVIKMVKRSVLSEDNNVDDARRTSF